MKFTAAYIRICFTICEMKKKSFSIKQRFLLKIHKSPCYQEENHKNVLNFFFHRKLLFLCKIVCKMHHVIEKHGIDWILNNKLETKCTNYTNVLNSHLAYMYKMYTIGKIWPYQIFRKQQHKIKYICIILKKIQKLNNFLPFNNLKLLATTKEILLHLGTYPSSQ